MKGDELQRVVAGLNARSQVEAFEAAKVVWKDTDVRLERALIKTLKRGSRPFNRAAAAQAMGAMLHRPQVIAALENAVDDKSENPRVRGEAAEALHVNHRKKSHDLLLRNLTDPSKEVRFWCAYTLGQMKEHRAIPTLERLSASDNRLVKGFHSVAKEAADAIETIKPTTYVDATKAARSALNDCQGHNWRNIAISNNVGAVKHPFVNTTPCTRRRAPFRSRGWFCAFQPGLAFNR